MKIKGYKARIAAVVVGLLGAGPALAASIFVNADINTSTTWTANNEYILTDRIYVTGGSTLTIEAGTVVRG